MLKRFFSIFNAACPGCGEEEFPPLKGRLCSECTRKLSFINQSLRCPGCGGENHGIADLCPQCLAEPPRPWQDAFAIFSYRGYGRDIIRKFKFANTPELARPLGYLAAELLLTSGINAEFIVPMPLNFIRYMKRSYNQAGLLADIISTRSGIPVSRALHRRLSLRHQTVLGRKKRHAGLKNAFFIKRNDLCGKHILLIDDVLTTGATLSAAAKTLQQDAGAASVTVLVIARSVTFTSDALK